MIRSPRRALVLACAAAALALVACAGASPSGDTEDVVTQIPFGPGERLVYAIRNEAGTRLGTGTFSVVGQDGRLSLRQEYEEAAPPPGMPPNSDAGAVEVDPTTLKPLSGSRQIERRVGNQAPTDGYTWTYGESNGKDVLRSNVIKHDGKPSMKDITLRAHYYDNETSLWLWRTLAFSEGYEKFYVSANAVEQQQHTVNLSIRQRETVEVPAGTFEAWRLIFRNGRAVRTAWVNVNAPHEVVKWDNGELLFVLESSSR